MCFILTVAFVFATLAFFSKGLMIQALISGVIASIALFFLIRKLITNGRCIFGKDRDCNKK
jgi:multisubunit Na+/H+ antiporter MnhE subunit